MPNKPKNVSGISRALIGPGDPADAQAAEAPSIRGNDFPIAGVGASAGGLDAFMQFLQPFPSHPGMAIVLIQHLDPTHGSQLTEILSRKSAMPIREVQAEMPVEADHVYVIAPGTRLTIANGILHPEPRPTGAGARNMPVDDFLQTLAQDQGSAAFGVILSGTASEGTVGLRAIKAAGGITFAQDPGSAKFDGMPRSAIAAASVDFVLTPEGITRQLLTIAGHSYLQSDVPPGSEGDLNRIFAALRSAAGVDFSFYKRNTILRRIKRRMALHGTEDFKDYARRLQQDAAEAKVLAQDFLISVTAFFREPEAHATLREIVLPALLESRPPDSPIRIWVPGCATGEEPYSLAIGLTEFLGDRAIGIQIFATDISEPALAKARAGVYPESALGGVSPERLRRFFVKTENGYQVSRAIRELCVFARQDLIKDPPFSKLDLISCCNLLIYLGPVLQKKTISLFHYALKPAGFLMLGNSESLGALSASFDAVDKKYKIYSKRGDSVRPEPGSLGQSAREPEPPRPAAGDYPNRLKSLRNEADRMLLAEYAPAGVIVDDSLHILQVFGQTAPYLQLAPGEPTTDLTKMVRPGLLAGLNAAFRNARRQNATAREPGLRVKEDNRVRSIDLRISPMRFPQTPLPGKERCFLVLFEEPFGREIPTKGRAKGGKSSAVEVGLDREVARLETELLGTREYLQSIIESQEAATEELRSANEEAQASNEELDTAKEELQATNEELNTVNDELSSRNSELSQLNTDLHKLLESIDVPLVMVGRDLRIRRFTDAVKPLLNLIPSDHGRAITDLRSAAIPEFREMLLQALEGKEIKHREIQGPGGRWFSMRILPYREPDGPAAGPITGAVATWIDIDDVKRAGDFAESVIATVREPLIMLDALLRIRTANDAFYRMFATEARLTTGRSIFDIGEGQWNVAQLRQLLEDILPKRSWLEDFEIEHNSKQIGARTLLLNAREIKPGGGERMILLAIEDITARKRAAEDLRRTNDDLKQFIFAASHDLQEPLRMVVSYTQLLAKTHAGQLDEDAKTFSGYAVKGALRMEALVSGLREFWQVSEQAEAPRSPVDSGQVLETALAGLQISMIESGAVVTNDPLPALMVSQIPLIQLFQNLLSNAIKYRSNQPPRIHVSAVRNSSDWVFSVLDNGIGIDPQYALQVFKVFKRLHGPDKYPGTGIGLSICQKIVERYGGRIWVESNSGQGSVFKFTMPS